jgi:hypothetical protein
VSNICLSIWTGQGHGRQPSKGFITYTRCPLQQWRERITNIYNRLGRFLQCHRSIRRPAATGQLKPPARGFSGFFEGAFWSGRPGNQRGRDPKREPQRSQSGPRCTEVDAYLGPMPRRRRSFDAPPVPPCCPQRPQRPWTLEPPWRQSAPGRAGLIGSPDNLWNRHAR